MEPDAEDDITLPFYYLAMYTSKRCGTMRLTVKATQVQQRVKSATFGELGNGGIHIKTATAFDSETGKDLKMIRQFPHDPLKTGDVTYQAFDVEFG